MQMKQTTGCWMSRFAVAMRIHKGGLEARPPIWCAPLTPADWRRQSLSCQERKNWTQQEWARMLLTEESQFSMTTDWGRIHIWREQGKRNHYSNIFERSRLEGTGVLVWAGIMLCSTEILLPYVRLFRGAMGKDFLFMKDNAPPHCTAAAEELL